MQRDNRTAIDLSHIDDYRINTPSELDTITNDEKVENIIGKTIKEEKLHKHTQISYRARRDFITLLNKVLFNYDTDNHSPKETPANDAIELQKLLGSGGLSAYKAAIIEECASKEFRNAVFLKACTHFEGKKWAEQMILWVGGPSASGKSYGANAAVKKIGHDVMMKERPDNLNGNDVVSIDGSIEREVSQIRQLTLQVALKKGYSGIKDLHSHTKIGLKKLIEGVALVAKLSIVIPNTFTGLNPTKKVKKLDKVNGAVQIFSEVSPADGMDADFKKTVERMGNERAWKLKYGMSNAEDIEIKYNNYDIGVESKNYNKEYFARGRSKSMDARNEYLEFSKDKIYACIVNDLIYVNKDISSGKWVKCEDESEQNCLKISKRDFDAWNNDIKDKPDLPEWLDQQKREKKLAQPIITIDVRGKRFLQGRILELENEIYELIRDNRVRRTSSGSRNMSDGGSPTKKPSLFKSGFSSRAGSGTFGSLSASPSYNISPSSSSRSSSSSIEIPSMRKSQESSEQKRQNIIDKFKPLIAEIAKSDETDSKKLEMLDKIELLLNEANKIEGKDNNDIKAIITNLERSIESNRKKLTVKTSGSVDEYSESHDSDSFHYSKGDDHEDIKDIYLVGGDSSSSPRTFVEIIREIQTQLKIQEYSVKYAMEWWNEIQGIEASKNEKQEVSSLLLKYAGLCNSESNSNNNDITTKLLAEISSSMTSQNTRARRSNQSSAKIQATLNANNRTAPELSTRSTPVPPARPEQKIKKYTDESARIMPNVSKNTAPVSTTRTPVPPPRTQQTARKYPEQSIKKSIGSISDQNIAQKEESSELQPTPPSTMRRK